MALRAWLHWSIYPAGGVRQFSLMALASFRVAFLLGFGAHNLLYMMYMM